MTAAVRPLSNRALSLFFCFLMIVALLLTGCTPQDRFDVLISAAHRAFADGNYASALADFAAARQLRPDDRGACFGEALAQLQLGNFADALPLFDRLVTTGSGAERAYALANRGILHDRCGRHVAALADYDAALQLNPEVAAGPGFMSRFLHNQTERPPGIADRARYLRAELAKPATERLLSLPAEDARQRPYKP